MRIYGFHPSTDYKWSRRRSCIFHVCMYIHCFTLQSFTAKQFSLIIDQPRLLGWMLPLLSKFWHKWERLYWIIQRWRPFVIHILCMSFFLFPIFFYLHTDDVKILSSFFYHQIFFSAFSLMKSWLTRMNSLQSFLYVATLQWNLYRKNWNDSVVTCLIAWLYILRTINALILFTDLTKMIYQHADFVKINEIIEYNILSILWKGFVTLPNQ